MLYFLFSLIALVPPLFNASWDLWILTCIHLLTIGVLATCIFRTTQGKFVWYYSQIDFYFLLFLLFCFISYFFSLVRFNSRNEIYNYLNYYFLFVLASYFFAEIRKKLFFLFMLFAIALFISGLALWQGWQSRAIIGTLLNANILSSYLVMCMLMVLSVLWKEIYSASPRMIRIYYLLASFIVFAVTLFLTRSLGGWISFFCGLCIFFLLAYKTSTEKMKLRYSLLGITSVVLVGLILVYFGVAKFSEPGVWNRVRWWKGALDMIKDYPFSGVGLGNFGAIFPKYKTTGLNSLYAHNYFLQICSETGVFGLLSLFGLLFSIFSLYRKYLLSLEQQERFIAMGTVSMCGALLLHNFIDYSLHIPAIAILFWVLVGLSISSFPKKTIEISLGSTKKLLCLCGCLGASIVVAKPFVASQKYVQGLDELKLNNLAAAEKCFQWSVRLDDLNAQSYAFLGEVYTRSNKKDLGIYYLKKAISLNPYYGPFHHNLGLRYAELGNITEAVASVEQARNSYPAKPLYHYTLSVLYAKAGRTDEAQIELKRYQELLARAEHN